MNFLKNEYFHNCFHELIHMSLADRRANVLGLTLVPNTVEKLVSNFDQQSDRIHNNLLKIELTE